MNRSLIILALVAGCGASGNSQSGANMSGGGTGGAQQAGAPVEAASADASLTGLWQSGGGTRPNQMCILDRKGKAQFGITLWGPNLRACSGAGTVTRSGNHVRFAMAGDSGASPIDRSSSNTSRIDCQRSSGSFARHRFTSRSS